MDSSTSELSAACAQLRSNAREAEQRHAAEASTSKRKIAELQGALEAQKESHDRAYSALEARASEGASALSDASAKAAALAQEKL